MSRGTTVRVGRASGGYSTARSRRASGGSYAASRRARFNLGLGFKVGGGFGFEGPEGGRLQL